VVDAAEAALLASGCQIYHRGGELMRPCRVGQLLKKETDVKRDDDAVVLVPVTETWLTEQFNRTARWVKVTKIGGQPVKSSVDPKAVYARTLLHRNGEWRFPALRGVVGTPTIALDGRLIQAPGYDVESRLLVNIASGEFPPVPERPTVDDARAALKALMNPFRKMPFINASSRAVVASGMLTALIRTSLRTAPLHAFDSPTPGTGKSLTSETIGIFATGALPPAMSQGKTTEEDEKRLATVLHYGDPVIHLDNCELPLTGDFLCSLLTQEVVQARILGESERRVLPTTALVLASGNNLVFAGDVTRRAVVARIDAKMERPDERKFDFCPKAETRRDRRKMVCAALTMLRAYHEADRPMDGKLGAMGSFEDWEFVRGTLVWLGEADPLETRQSIYNGDPQREEFVDIVRLWHQAYQKKQVTVGEVEKNSTSSETIGLLKMRFIEINPKGVWSGRTVGRWLMQHKERVTAGLFFTPVETSHEHRWCLRSVQGDLGFKGEE
jgi:hypothetical protein